VPRQPSRNARHSTFEQHLRKPSGRSTEFKTDAVPARKPKEILRRSQFQRTAGNVRMRRREFDSRALVQQLCRFPDENSVGTRLAGLDRRARPRTQHGVAVLKKKAVGARFCRWRGLAQGRLGSRRARSGAFGSECGCRATEGVERRCHDALRIQSRRFVHPLGRLVIDEAVRQHHRPDLQT